MKTMEEFAQWGARTKTIGMTEDQATTMGPTTVGLLHRNEFPERKIMKPKYWVLAALITASTAMAQTMPKEGGTSVASNDWMFSTSGPKWWYQAQPSKTITMLDTRQATRTEQQVIDRVSQMMTQYPIKAVALIDGNKVVHQDFNAPAGPISLIYGFSMGKTVTSMMVGQAICQNKLSLTTKAEELIPELKGKQLGSTTVRDLLRMASGTKHEDNDGNMFTPDQGKQWTAGTLNLVDVIAEDRNATAEKGVFSDYKPGEHFAYKNSNPSALGMMVSRATGMTYAQWMQANVLDPMGAAEKGIVAQDKNGDGLAEGALRLRFEDWIRFAMWVKASSKEQGCFGDYVRAATKTQIKNGPAKSQRHSGQLFAGYGYLTWTDNEIAPNMYWASGYGGQRIGWSNDSDRIIIVFSGAENWMPALYELGKAWNKASD